MERNMDKDYFDVPLSESNVSLKLEDIRKRCSDLMDEPEAMLELSLEEPAANDDAPEENTYDPYDRG